jgi:hypothetical protein
VSKQIGWIPSRAVLRKLPTTKKSKDRRNATPSSNFGQFTGSATWGQSVVLIQLSSIGALRQANYFLVEEPLRSSKRRGQCPLLMIVPII